MKTTRLFGILGVCAMVCAVIVGCTSPSYTTSPYHPGPAIGRGLGTAVGVTAGNAAGVGVGFTEGVVRGAAAPFDTTTYTVRTWHTNTTADGRVILVPEDILVDANGNPVGRKK